MPKNEGFGTNRITTDPPEVKTKGSERLDTILGQFHLPLIFIHYCPKTHLNVIMLPPWSSKHPLSKKLPHQYSQCIPYLTPSLLHVQSTATAYTQQSLNKESCPMMHYGNEYLTRQTVCRTETLNGSSEYIHLSESRK